MTWGLTAVAAATVGSALITKSAADKAARGQEQAAQTASDVQERMFQKQIELQEPWRKAGMNALAQIGGGFTGKVDLTQDPGYAFRLAEGQKALERTAAARGGLLSGGAMREAQRYGQGLASQEYQNAYNRALTQYNTLASLAGVGQTAAGQMAGEAGTYGTNAANLAYGAGTGAAQTRASGYMGAANALTSGLGAGLNYYQGNQMMNYLKGAGTPAVQPGGYSPVPQSSTPFFIGGGG